MDPTSQLELVKAQLELTKLQLEMEKQKVDFYRQISQGRNESEITLVADIIARLDTELFKEIGDMSHENIMHRNPYFTTPTTSHQNQPSVSTEKITILENSSASTSTIELQPFDLSKRQKLKILVCGMENSGKTTFLEMHDNARYLEKHKPTKATKARSFDVEAKKDDGSSNDVKNLTLVMIDTPGNYNVFRDTTLSNCKEASAVLLFYDLSNDDSYLDSGLPKWHRYIRSRCKKDIPIIVCGNKSDLISSSSSVTQRFAINDDNLEFCKMSCKNYKNHKYPFSAVTRKILNSQKYKVKVRPVSRRERNMNKK